jgi:serine phosphatase RsbU (regulator of sigma subunit)
MEDMGAGHTRVERVGDMERGRLAQHRLDLLVQCASTIHGAANETALADAVLESLLAGTGFHHAVLLRPRPGAAEDEVEVIGHRHRTGSAMQEVHFSRSLIAEASAGEMVRLVGQADLPRSVSIAELGISSALCAPIMLGSSVAAYIYLDARGQAAPIESDAAGFCQAVSRMCGLALANLKRLDLERRQQTLEAAMNAAREAQQLIVPASEGTVGAIRYAVQNRPGFFVAGDLFDVIDLGDGRVAVSIGDVMGEGVAAGVIMAAAQSHLHAALQHTDDPATAVNAVNEYLAARSAENRFVSLWLGIFDSGSASVRFVDAGHGHWFLCRKGEAPGQPEFEGGIPVGIQAGYPYETEELALMDGDRIILYSDGLLEQGSKDGAMFGKQRIVDLIADSPSAAEDVRRLLAGLESFAGGSTFHDDTTIASIEVAANG